MTVSNSWVTGKQAVNFFSTWCAARSWVFQPVDASNDFGKDGYVDITDDGRLTGELFSVQVKGGESWTAAGGYSIPVGKHLYGTALPSHAATQMPSLPYADVSLPSARGDG